MTTMGTTSLNTFIENDGTFANLRNLRQSTYANLSLPASQRPSDNTLLPFTHALQCELDGTRRELRH